MSPDWFHNLHHLVAGAILACLLTVLLRSRIRGAWLLIACAIGLTMSAEAINEIAEWRLIRGATAEASVYYDVIADLAMTLLGASIGALIAAFARWRRKDVDVGQ